MSWAITSSGISFGHALVHSPVFVQPPKPGVVVRVDHRDDALVALRLALRQQAEVGDLGAGNSIAEAFGQAATHAPQPMQAAASKARSASALRHRHGVRVGRRAGVHR